MAETRLPNPSADDLKKQVLEIFEDATKDCEDENLRGMFYSIGWSYDSLNDYAVKIFSIMADMGKAEKAREMFKPFSNLGILSPVAVYTIVISLYAAERKAESALKVYWRMIASGFNPVSYTYTHLIVLLATDFSNAKYLRYAKKYFLESLDKGLKLDPTPFWQIIRAIAYKEPVEKFEEFIKQIKVKGLNLHENGFYYKETYLAKAREVQKMYAHLVHNETVDKDVRAYFYLKTATAGHMQKLAQKMCTALEVDGNFDEAVEFSKGVNGSPAEPMVVIHTSVMKAYLKFGKIKGALEAYQAMLAAGIAPTSYTYNVLIKGLSADPNFFEDAKKCMLEMMDKGKRPNAATYTAVIEGFTKQKGKEAAEEGKEFVRVMMDTGFVPNAKAVMEVLKGRPTPAIRSVMSIVLSALKQ